jgi:DNA ligase-1
MQRLGRIYNVETMQQQVPVMLYLFDCLLREDRSLLDEPSSRRWDELVDIAGNIPLVPRVLPRSLAEGEAFLAAARAAGHEGVMAKSLTSPYTPGRRGTAWLKVKPAITLDLVVVAADWGYGRRHGWLSNYHLAARDAETGEFLVVGKTFKGLTDAEFQQMTEDLLALKIREQRGTVTVIPRLVVEVAFNNIQASPQYASGLALRFARIVRRRPDKDPAEVDTIQTMRQLYAREQGMDYREEDNAGTDYLSPGD